jgi:hypothetical protein
MASEANVQLYMEGLCKVATQGNVSVNFAWFANRMELFCNKCKQTLTAAKPEDTTIDYAVQEFLKLHLHKVHPDYCSCETCAAIVAQKQKETWGDKKNPWAKNEVPLTADFKPVPQQSFTGEEAYKTAMDAALTKPDAVVMTNIEVPDPDGYGLTNLPKIKPPMNNYDKDAPYLAEKLKSVQQEYAAKVNDVANKIKLLQLSSQEAKLEAMQQKVAAAQKAFEEQAKAVTAEDGVYYSKETVEKLKQQLEGFGYKKPLQIIQHQPYVPPQPPAPAPKKEKPLKQAAGRKIR